MESILDGFAAEFDTFLAMTPRILAGVLLFVLFLIAGRLASRGVRRLAARTERESRTTRLIGRIMSMIFGILGLVMALHVMGLTAIATSLLATGGILAVVLGFAFKEIGENLLAGIMLSFSRSFNVGDLIESDGLRGIVRAVNLRDVHVRTADGCDIFIPSAAIYRNALRNYTRDGLRRVSFELGIDYGDDPASARTVMREAIEGSPGVLTTPPPSVEIMDLSDAYVRMQGHLWVDTFSGSVVSTVRSEAINRVHRALAENGFTFSSNVTTAVDMRPVTVRVDETG
ncbi:MAG: mechanosensitive ion channel family protein [Rhodothermales bacterium]|nr:mechanosensitive ion channel family protein [Rhodothermales bacterium]